jgi:hypothetical protein
MLNDQPQHHEMVLETIHDSGAEEWYCPVCGRRFLMQWPPHYSKIILEPGDENAIHSGGKTEVEEETYSVDEALSTPPQFDWAPAFTELEDNSLVPYMDWMEHSNFCRLWE